MQMQVERMSSALLSGLLIFQWLTVAVAIYYGQMSLDWQNAPDELFKHSPDAHHNMMWVSSTWLTLKGACLGVAVNMILLAIGRRREIAAGSWLVKLQWFGFILPIPVILWFGKNIQ